MTDSIEYLIKRIRANNGEDYAEPEPNWDLISDKIIYSSVDYKFGDKVKIYWHPKQCDCDCDDPVNCESTFIDHGYLMTIPPYNDIDLESVIHIPHPYVEKEVSIPEWITLIDCAMNENVYRIIIG
jgi:hypothetical protein